MEMEENRYVRIGPVGDGYDIWYDTVAKTNVVKLFSSNPITGELTKHWLSLDEFLRRRVPS